jgi:hypothetical protein
MFCVQFSMPVWSFVLYYGVIFLFFVSCEKYVGDFARVFKVQYILRYVTSYSDKSVILTKSYICSYVLI